MAGAFLDDPNRTAVGMEPIWTGAPDDGLEATGATAGIPGTWTPPGSSAPGSVSDLMRGRPNPVVASPATPWTSGQFVQTMTSGAPGRATWTGSAWVGGVAAGTTGSGGEDGLPGNPAAFTIAQIEEWVDAHPHLAADVLTHERARGDGGRVTLIDWLEGFLEAHDGTATP